jgi:hypothetical protein
MSAICAIGSILAIVFFVLGIAALPLLRKATKEGRKIMQRWQDQQMELGLEVASQSARLRFLESLHYEEMEFLPVLLVSKLRAVDHAVRLGYLTREEGATLQTKISAKLVGHERKCVEIKPEPEVAP